MKIGDLNIESRLLLAPMAGVTDLPYRIINRRLGCRFAFTEMVNARALAYGNRKTHQILSTSPEDSPLGVQLLGNDRDCLLEALDKLDTGNFSILDFNAGCPARKVVSSSGGASLMKDPDSLYRLIETLVKNSPLPVTVKIRTGWDSESVNAPETAVLAEEAGAKALFIHGRTKQQGFSGEIDYETIRKVKNSVSIPVIGSGNIFTPAGAADMFEKTGCDGILVARGTCGNPWIFSDIQRYLDSGDLTGPRNGREVAEIMRDHFDLVTEHYGEKRGPYIFRKYFIYYTRSFSNVRPLRRLVFRLTDTGEIRKAIDRFGTDPAISRVAVP